MMMLESWLFRANSAINRHAFWLFIILWVLPFVQSIENRARLTAINNSLHAAELYSKVINDERPPTVSEPQTNAELRKWICRDITESDYFEQLMGMAFIDMDRPQVLRELQRPRYFEIFDLVYERSNEDNALYYSNPYHLRNFKVDVGLGRRRYRSYILTKEWVFVCLVRKSQWNSSITPYFVSREYDTGSVLTDGSTSVHIAARFIFEHTSKIQRIAMAEEPARGYVSPDFNIEHYYVELKKDHLTAYESDEDPFCQIISKRHPHNQHARLCASVLGSSYFRGKIMKYSRTNYRDHCSLRSVSFQTGYSNQMRTDEQEYYEWMIPCRAKVAQDYNASMTFYISRAYKSNQLFIYTISNSNNRNPRRLYLENLSTRISIVDNGQLNEKS